MAIRKQVSCINKNGHYDAHKRIEYIGGIHNNLRWKLPEDRAIANIKNRSEEYYVVANGRSVDVIVATHDGHEYLKTKDDGYAPNNLLNLPECPR